MNYKIINEQLNDISNPKKTILINRGIVDYESYLNLNESCLHDYNLLDNISDAVKCYLKHVENNNDVHVVCDCDTDGNTSAAEIYSYTKKLNPNITVTYSIHSKKQHGLTSDIEIPESAKLVIIPDASSNDVKQCKELYDKGIDVIVLDHHECDVENKYAIVVNNQMCNYPNKQLCGAAIVYKFLQAVDEETWNNYADDYLDLVALGLIADNMDVKQFETRYLIDKGLNKIRNKFFKALIEKQSYSLGSNFTSKDIQFCIVPMINGMIRAGDYDEKELMFRAFIETDEIFKYKKRGSTDEVDENIYDKVARLCSNARSRQNKSKDNSLLQIYSEIEKRNLHNNKIIFANVTKILNETMTGVVAIKVAEHYNRPCLLLRKKEDSELYGGSGRNTDNSPIENLKDFLNGLGVFNFVQGHQGAFGFEINKEKIDTAIEIINHKLKDFDLESYIYVDFVIDGSQLDIGLIKNLDTLKRFYGTGFKEPVLVVENLTIDKSQFTMMGKENNSWKVITDEGVAIVNFKISEDDLLKNKFSDESCNCVTISLIGTPNINNYKGILTSQLIVKNYEIVEVN